MIFNILNNLPPVTKNFLIINILMLFASTMFENQHIYLNNLLGAHNFLSPVFEPFQIVTHFFMHGDLMHLVFNMFGLLIFGSKLERMWGGMRFFWFYIISALGALLFYAGFGTWEMYQYQQEILAMENGQTTIAIMDDIIRQAVMHREDLEGFLNTRIYEAYLSGDIILPKNDARVLGQYFESGFVPMVGASGAIYGILVGFAYLNPNQEFLLLFPPIPIKAKYLAGILMLSSLYFSFNDDGSNVAHLAHLGGGAIGFIQVLLMQRNRNHFY